MHNLEIPGAIPGPATSQKKGRLRDGFSFAYVAGSEQTSLLTSGIAGRSDVLPAGKTARRGREHLARRRNMICDRSAKLPGPATSSTESRPLGRLSVALDILKFVKYIFVEFTDAFRFPLGQRERHAFVSDAVSDRVRFPREIECRKIALLDTLQLLPK